MEQACFNVIELDWNDQNNINQGIKKDSEENLGFTDDLNSNSSDCYWM